MFEVAKALGGKRLCDVSLDQLMERLNEVRDKVGSDRAILRAIHFFTENDRVDRMGQAMQSRNSAEVVRIIEESGNSSYKQLQNCLVPSISRDQGVALNLGLSEVLNREFHGVCRVHGGGFAGVILEVLPNEHAAEYIARMSEYAGAEYVYPLSIRKVGAVRI